MKAQSDHFQQANDSSKLTLWLSTLPKYTIPLNTSVAQKVKRDIVAPDATAKHLADVIQQDPILCLQLFLSAHQQLKQKESDIQGMVHLIGLLGFNQIQQTLEKAKVEVSAFNGQKELLSASLFSAHLANHLMPDKHGTRGTRFFLPTLFFNAPLWLMWTAAPKLMGYGQIQASQKGMPLELVCKKHLGFSLHSLLNQTDVLLPLPHMTLKALAIDFHKDMAFWAKVKRHSNKSLKHWLDNDKTTKQLFNSVETGIYLINQYVLAIYLDWQGKHIKRWSTLLIKYFGITPEQLDKNTIDVATQLNLPKYLSGQFSPLHRYRGLHRGLSNNKSAHSENIINRYLKQLKASYSLHDCLQLTLEALTEGAQVEHCIIIRIVEDEQLQIPISYGFEDKSLQSVQIDSHDHGQLIRNLLQKPMALSIDRSKLKRIEQQLPKELTLYWQPRPCGIMSLFHDSKPYAIIACDHKDWDEQRHQQFKTIGKQLSQTLKQCKVSDPFDEHQKP